MKMKINDSNRRTMIGKTNVADYPNGIIVFRLSFINDQNKRSEIYDNFDIANKRYEELQKKSNRVNFYITLMIDNKSEVIVDEELIMSWFGDDNN